MNNEFQIIVPILSLLTNSAKANSVYKPESLLIQADGSIGIMVILLT